MTGWKPPRAGHHFFLGCYGRSLSISLHSPIEQALTKIAKKRRSAKPRRFLF